MTEVPNHDEIKANGYIFREINSTVFISTALLSGDQIKIKNLLKVERVYRRLESLAIPGKQTIEGLPELLQNSDYFVNVLPSTPDTRNLLSGDILSNCKEKKSVFINAGRGDVIDEETVVKAIRSGWLGGAVLDVFMTEPIPPESPVWKLPGVIITPHVSGWSSDESHARKVNDCFIRNYHHYVAGEPLEGVLDWKQGY